MALIKISKRAARHFGRVFAEQVYLCAGAIGQGQMLFTLMDLVEELDYDSAENLKAAYYKELERLREGPWKDFRAPSDSRILSLVLLMLLDADATLPEVMKALQHRYNMTEQELDKSTVLVKMLQRKHD